MASAHCGADLGDELFERVDADVTQELRESPEVHAEDEDGFWQWVWIRPGAMTLIQRQR